MSEKDILKHAQHGVAVTKLDFIIKILVQHTIMGLKVAYFALSIRYKNLTI